MRSILIAFAVLLVARPAIAGLETYYVPGDAEDITSGIDLVAKAGGGILSIAPGVYYESNLVVENVPWITFDAEDVVVDSNGGEAMILLGSQVQIIGMTFRNASSALTVGQHTYLWMNVNFVNCDAGRNQGIFHLRGGSVVYGTVWYDECENARDTTCINELGCSGYVGFLNQDPPVECRIITDGIDVDAVPVQELSWGSIKRNWR